MNRKLGVWRLYNGGNIRSELISSLYSVMTSIVIEWCIFSDELFDFYIEDVYGWIWGTIIWLSRDQWVDDIASKIIFQYMANVQLSLSFQAVCCVQFFIIWEKTSSWIHFKLIPLFCSVMTSVVVERCILSNGLSNFYIKALHGWIWGSSFWLSWDQRVDGTMSKMIFRYN